MTATTECHEKQPGLNFHTFLQCPVSLYIHLPWCLKKCPYCDFNSHAAINAHFPENDYTDQLINDLQQTAPLLLNREVQSIFIGGGTPSLFSPVSIERLLSACKEHSAVSPTCEITLETNPGTFEADKFAAFLACGINRLSIGVQSFNDHYLQKLGRIHSARESLNAIQTAASIGFDNINIDLMFGLPEQSLDDALEEISIACQQPVNHISYYQLTLEPNTVFYRYPPTLPDSDQSWKMQTAAMERLQQAGYNRYEVSAFCKTDQECQHNLNYWRYGDYLGIGAGAHSKLTNKQHILRQQRPRQPESYMRAVENCEQVIHQLKVSEAESPFEFMLNHLRLVEGFTRDRFEQSTGLAWPSVTGALDSAIEDGLLVHTDTHYRASEIGYRFLDQLVERFLPA
jgi:oxygen-independent coproporphyrinogen-3 oxidase